MKFEATYYDGVHPSSEKVTVFVSSNGKTSVVNSAISYSCDWKDIAVSSQLGNTARNLQLPNGAKCETHAHEQINQLA